MRRALRWILVLGIVGSVAAGAIAATSGTLKNSALTRAANTSYGPAGKVSICVVTPNGKQHTITISANAVAAYLRTHPLAFRGICGRTPGATVIVCVKLANGKVVPVHAPPAVKAYLKRNAHSRLAKKGKC